MDDPFDVTLEDAELLAEVELTTNLIIAASEASAKLSQAEIDQALGLADLSVPPQRGREDTPG